MKIVYFIIGIISLGLGLLGIALPILPTTPFLLLATVALAKSSTRMHTWLTNAGFYKKHMSEFVTNRSMTLETKVKILAFASTLLIVSFCLVDVIYARISIIAVMIFKYYYFFARIKTIRKEEI